MQRPDLKDHIILVVEDEALQALDIAQALEASGADVTTTTTLRHARLLVEHDHLSAAVLDHQLLNGDANDLCARLRQRGIPFILCSGFSEITGPCADAPRFAKPADPQQIAAKLAEIIGR